MEFTPLTPEHKQQFEEQGYLVVPNALDAETTARIMDAGDRLCATEITEHRFTSNNGQYDGFRNCIAMDDAYLELLAHPSTVPLVVQLFGPRIQLMTSHLIHKKPNEPGTPASFRNPGWHRDIAYTPDDLGHAHIPRMEMKIAYYLSDMSEPNSGITLFAPGSNHLKAPLHIPDGQTDPENAIELLLNPGDAVFFENRTWHAGAVNLRSQTAKMVMFGYGFWWLKPMDYLTQPESLLEKTDSIGRQLLGGLRDPEGRFVPGGIHQPLQAWCTQHHVQYVPAP